MKILIKITKEVLEKTKMCGHNGRWITSSCAISYAVREIFPGAFTGPTGLAGHSWSINLRYKEIPIPIEASDYAMLFDRTSVRQRINLPEFSFEIEVPAEVIDKIGLSDVYKILSESRTLELTSIQ